MARFDKVNLEISNVCNLQCSFCPEVVRTKGFMEPALFARIIEQIAPITDQVAFHLMGDPLVHPRLEELVEICHSRGVRIFLVTNGVLMRERQSELLLHPAFRQVNFSLHSFYDNYPERDAGPYLERIFAFVDAALDRRPELYVNFRLWNLEDPRGTGEKNQDMLRRIEERYGVGVDGVTADVRRSKSHRIRGRLYLHFDTEFVWPSLDLPELGSHGRCHGLSSHFGILVDGTVVPCCLDKEAAIPLGNVKDLPLLEILESPRALEMVRGFRERRLVEELCKRCQYIERFT